MLNFTVEQARRYAGLTIRDMSDRLGMHKDTYRAKEKAPSKFSVPEAKKISKVTGVPMDLIIF